MFFRLDFELGLHTLQYLACLLLCSVSYLIFLQITSGQNSLPNLQLLTLALCNLYNSNCVWCMHELCMFRPKAEVGIFLYCSLFLNCQHLLIYCVRIYVGASMPQHMYRGQRTTRGSWFSPSIMQVWESNSWDLVAKHLHMLESACQYLSSLKIQKIVYLSISVYVCSLLLLCKFQELNSRCQAWRQRPFLPATTSFFFFFLRQISH